MGTLIKSTTIVFSMLLTLTVQKLDGNICYSNNHCILCSLRSHSLRTRHVSSTVKILIILKTTVVFSLLLALSILNLLLGGNLDHIRNNFVFTMLLALRVYNCTLEHLLCGHSNCLLLLLTLKVLILDLSSS